MNAHSPTIEMMPVGALKPYRQNARTHSKKQVGQIADSIKRFGFTNPVLVSDEMEIVAGNGRVEAAKVLGGRALLRRKADAWVLTLCSGDALKEAKSLQHFGLNAEEAEAMAKAVVDAEAKLDPALVAKFATFDGVVMMDGEGHHPPVERHGTEHKG